MSDNEFGYILGTAYPNLLPVWRTMTIEQRGAFLRDHLRHLDENELGSEFIEGEAFGMSETLDALFGDSLAYDFPEDVAEPGDPA